MKNDIFFFSRRRFILSERSILPEPEDLKFLIIGCLRGFSPLVFLPKQNPKLMQADGICTQGQDGWRIAAAERGPLLVGGDRYFSTLAATLERSQEMIAR